jgi:hypothetical protein
MGSGNESGVELAARDSASEMSPTQRDVTFVTPDLDLIASSLYLVTCSHPYHHCGFAAAMTDGFDLNQFIGPSE